MSSQTPHLLGSICDTCTKYGKKVVVVNSENDPEKERLMTLDLLDQRVEGLLVISGYNSDFYQGLDRERLPVVLADRVSEHVDMDSVVVNHAESTRHVVNYLLKQGYQRIVILQRPHINPYNTLAIRVAAARQLPPAGTSSGTTAIVCSVHFLLRLQAAPRAASRNIRTCPGSADGAVPEVPTCIFVSEISIMLHAACSFYRAGMKRSSSPSRADDENISDMFRPICTTAICCTESRSAKPATRSPSSSRLFAGSVWSDGK